MTDDHMCNVIYRGKGYRFPGPTPAYDPYLSRMERGQVLLVLGLIGLLGSFRPQEYLEGRLALWGVRLLLVLVSGVGFFWWRKAEAAQRVFLNAPRGCLQSSADSDVFYAQK